MCSLYNINAFWRIALCAIGVIAVFFADSSYAAEVALPLSNNVASEAEKMDRVDSGSLQFFLLGEGTPIILSSRAASKFTEIISVQGMSFPRSGLSDKPLGYFVLSGLTFYWHGNALIKEDSDKRYVWTHPVLDEMIERLTVQDYKFSMDVFKPLEK